MTRMARPDCAVMCNLINTQRERERERERETDRQRETDRNRAGLRGYEQFNKYTTRMTGPDCAVMCNLINTHTQTHTHT